MPPPVTLDDVAAAAGVHPSTVSRTLSRPELVNAGTLATVQAAVAQLGYVPNRAARQLAGGPTATIAVLVPDITNPFFSATVRAAQREAGSTGRLVLLADTGLRPATELDAVRSLAPNVDGIIACAPVAPTGKLEAAAAGRPLVLVNRRARGLASVAVDQHRTTALAVDHLRRLGHRRIAVTRGPASYWSSAERLRCLDELDRAAGGTHLLRVGPFEPTFAGGRSALAAARRARATAVVAFNDVQALGLMAAAAERGLAVPDDLSVVGSDGIPFAATTVPGLTTVAAPVDELGALAVAVLDRLLAGGTTEQRTVLPDLVVRRSTSAPRTGRP